MRVVLDTAVIVAAIRSPDGASRLWLESVLMERHKLLLSVPLAIQYEAVLKRPEQLKAAGIDESEVEQIVDALCSASEEVDLLYLWRPLVRDPDDEMVIETAFVGRADLLITFNVRDFAGAEVAGVPILRPGDAWAKHGRS
jgi:putative PIN family toxin of toxin-antitoxin system